MEEVGFKSWRNRGIASSLVRFETNVHLIFNNSGLERESSRYNIGVFKIEEPWDRVQVIGFLAEFRNNLRASEQVSKVSAVPFERGTFFIF